MVQYIYFVKCPNCEDEHFDFFDEAKEFALGCLSQKPIITQIEVERNDFGECTDSHDLGTVWSWEDAMKDAEGRYTEAEPTKAIFTKDDLKRMADGQDPEFDDDDFYFDNGLVEEVAPVRFSFRTNSDREEFFKLCREIGIITGADLRKFMEETDANDGNLLDKLRAYRADLGDDFKIEECQRKSIPEGMTIEQLVEEMEENEDTVECTWCNDLFDKSECRKEVDLGWLCSRCEAAIKSRGETLTFKENNYWDFLDESTDGTSKHIRLVHKNSKYSSDGEPYQLTDLKSLLKSSDIRELDVASINLIAKFDNNCKIIQETDKAYLVTVPCYYRNQQDRSKFEERPKYIKCWVPKAQTEFINESVSEDSADVEVLHDLGNTYDGGYPETHTWMCYLNGNDLGTVEAATEEEAYLKMEQTWPEYRYNNEDVQVIPVDELEESTSKVDTLEEANEYSKRLTTCPECGEKSYDAETSFCISCGFN